MKIIFICRRYIPGEAWTNRVLAYAKGFAEQGVVVELCFLIGDKNRNDYNISIPGVNVVDFWKKDNGIAKKNRYISFVCNLFRCWRYICRNDLVFVYGAAPYLLKLALGKTKNVYAEITEHPYMKGGERTALPLSRIKELNKLRGLFVISSALRQYFIEQGVRPEIVHISNMFVDTNRFNECKKDACDCYFAYCGVVSTYKDGVDVLIHAFKLFHENHPDYKLLIIGRFESDSVKKELESLTSSLMISDSVLFTGQIAPEEMPRLLSNAQALVLARPENQQSRYGFPTKLGEYLATGNPVIVTNVGEISTFIEDRINGLLVPPGDAKAFEGGMSWVVEHPEEAKEMGTKGQKLAQFEFSYKTQSKKVLNIIQNSSI